MFRIGMMNSWKRNQEKRKCHGVALLKVLFTVLSERSEKNLLNEYCW